MNLMYTALTSRGETRINPRNVKQFSGKEPERILETFDELEEAAFVNDWNTDSQKIKAVRAAFTDEAHAKFLLAYQEGMSYQELKEELIELHLDQNVLWRISDQYNRISQESNETVDAFYKRFKFLARVRNYHSRPSRHTEMMGATDFQDGLYNKQMKDNVSRQEPRTVLQAYMAAKREERMSYMHKPQQPSRPPPSKQIASTTTQQHQPPNHHHRLTLRLP